MHRNRKAEPTSMDVGPEQDRLPALGFIVFITITITIKTPPPTSYDFSIHLPV